MFKSQQQHLQNPIKVSHNLLIRESGDRDFVDYGNPVIAARIDFAVMCLAIELNS
ncbi:MAG: hypothetical protein AAGL68_09285 [Pseudomonadota bacterium]